jgi:hypothetical protein
MRRQQASTARTAWHLPKRWTAAGVVLLAMLSSLGLSASPALASASAVGKATIQVSSLSTYASIVNYTVDFASTHALVANSSTITLTAPSGTVMPSGCYIVSDDITPGFSCGTGIVTGTTAVINVPIPVAAGDPVSVTAKGVVNPPTSGNKTFAVSTSSDTRAVDLHYKLTSEKSVGSASLRVSALSASASGVTYSFNFKSPGRLSGGESTIALAFPAGTVLPAGGCETYIMINESSGDENGCTEASTDGTTATVVAAMTTNAGNAISIIVNGVTNPATIGATQINLSTASDPETVHLHYTIAHPKSVTNPFLQLSSYASSATNAKWRVGFVVPDRLTWSQVAATSSTIDLTAPAGTVFPAGGCSVYTVIDAGPPAAQGPESGCVAATVSGGGTSVAISPGFDTNPGNTIFVIIAGVTNPTTMSSLSISTSTDPAAVTVPLSGPTAMSDTVQLSSTSASATEVLYTGTWASTGPLTANASTLTLSSPGATLPLCSGSAQYLIVDDITGAELGSCPVAGSVPGATITIESPFTTSTGDELSVLVTGVTNSSSSGGSTFSLTSPAGGFSLPIALSAETAVSAPIVSLTSTSASASVTEYSATFTVANGLIVSGVGDDFSTFPLSAAVGTVFPARGYATVLNDTTGTVAGSSYVGSGAQATVLPASGASLGFGPGDEVTVDVFGVTNPASGGSDLLSISTTSDPSVATAAYSLTGEKSVAKTILQLSSFAAGASNVTYAFAFQTANGLVSSTDSTSTMTVVFPAGTVLPSPEDVAVANDTTGAYCGGDLSSSGTTASITLTTGSCPGLSGPGDVFTLGIPGVTNAPTHGAKSVSLSTSSDPGAAATTFHLS